MRPARPVGSPPHLREMSWCLPTRRRGPKPQPGPGQLAGDLCNGTRHLGQGGIPPAFGRQIEPVAVSSQAPGGLVSDRADDRRRLFIVSVGVLALTGVASGVFMRRRRAN